MQLESVSSRIRQEISDRIFRFYQLVDQGRAASTADIFTEDARLTFGPGSPKPGTVEGFAIREAMAARELQVSAFTRHVVTNLIFAGARAEAVAVTYLLILFRSDDDTRSSLPTFVADLSETWVMRSNVWKLAERFISPTFSRS